MMAHSHTRRRGLRFVQWILRRKPRYSVFEVFTPTTQARVNVIGRPRVEAQLRTSLNTPGTQIVIFGESGSGKSTLLLNQLAEMKRSYVTTRCTANDSFSTILMSAFDQLDQWVATQRSESRNSEKVRQLALQIDELKAGASRRESRELGTIYSPLVAPHLNAQKLGQLLGAAGKSWVIEDFHKIPSSEKTALAQTLKVFSDLAVDHPQLRIIVVGATDSAKEVVEYDPEMNTRVSEILVPSFSEEELATLLSNGGALLNVSFHDVSDELVRHSVGLASTAHQLALNAMLNMGVERKAERLVTVTADVLARAAEKYVQESSATLKDRFDRGLRRVRVRKFDNGRLIIAALAQLPVDGATYAQLLDRIRSVERSYPPGNLTQNLKALMSEERGALVRQTAAGQFRFSEPLLHTYARLAFDNEAHRLPQDLFVEQLMRLLGDVADHRAAVTTGTSGNSRT